MKYTVIIRRSKLEYVGICLELNISSRGDDIAEVEKNLREAIELYLEDLKLHPETVVSPISMDEFIEFLKDTEPDWYRLSPETSLLNPFAVHEVPVYA